MTEREQLIKDIDEWCKWRHASSVQGRSLKQADELLQRARAMLDGWIPLSERLPEIGEPVITYWTDGISEVITRGADNYGWFEGYPFQNQVMTHWMPLPEPPTEE